MLKDMILNFDGKPPDSFLTGAKLPDRFELPDNILVFMHDWFPLQHFVHSRYMLIFPAVPVEYRIDGDAVCRIQPGQAMFSPPCQNRSLQANGGDIAHGYPRLMITFDLSRDTYYLPDDILLDVSPEAESILAELLSAFKEGRNADLSIRLFFLLRELSQHRANVQPVHYSPVVHAALKYINSHSGRNASLAAMAAEAKTSVSNLRLLFRKELGCPPGRFAAEHRMKVARYNLAMTSMRVEELAALCGFRSVYAFSHFFKKHTGMSPLAWRKRHREPEDQKNG